MAKSTRRRENCHTTVKMWARITHCSQGKGSNTVQVKQLLRSADLFRRVRKTARSDSQLRYVFPHGTTRHPLDGFPLTLVINKPNAQILVL